jgi:hypothetical protein
MRLVVSAMGREFKIAKLTAVLLIVSSKAAFAARSGVRSATQLLPMK